MTREEFDRLAIDAGVEPSDENFARMQTVAARLSRSSPFDRLTQAIQYLGLNFKEASRSFEKLTDVYIRNGSRR